MTVDEFWSYIEEVEKDENEDWIQEIKNKLKMLPLKELVEFLNMPFEKCTLTGHLVHSIR